MDNDFARQCDSLADEVAAAIEKYGIVEHPEFGKVYAFEADGFYNHVFMDDANVPSLLAMPYLGCIDVNDPVYQNTRKLVLSPMNPYFYKGKAGEGIGGPHIGFNYIWPMSIIMRCNTTSDNEEIRHCVKCSATRTAIPVSCTNRSTKTILRSSPVPGLPGLILCSVK